MTKETRDKRQETGDKQEIAKEQSPENKAQAKNKEQSTKKTHKKVTLSHEEHEVLLKKIEELEGIKDRLLRTAADYENSKKRLVKEKEDFLKYATVSLVSDILPVLDNLNRAIEQAEKANPDDPILKGIHLIEKGVFNVLKKHGLTRVEALDKPFSVEFHEALGQVETDEKEEGTVVEELEVGYQLNGRLIRPARVKVAKAREDQRPETGDKREEEKETKDKGHKTQDANDDSRTTDDGTEEE